MYRMGITMIVFCLMMSACIAGGTRVFITTPEQLAIPGDAPPMLLSNNKVYALQDTIYINKNEFAKSRNYGFNLKSGSQTQWIRLTVYNTDTTETEAIAELTNPFLNHVKFYALIAGNISDSLITGSGYDFSRRYKEHPNFLYSMLIPAKSAIHCYISIQTGNVSGDFRLIVWNKEKRNEYQLSETKYLSYFFIINISFLLLIGLAISLTRQRYHWYYFIYALFGFIYIYAEVGLGFKNIWPHHPKVQSICILLIANIYQIFGLLFVRKYFNTAERLPVTDKILNILIITGLAFEITVAGGLLFQYTLPKWFVLVNTLLFVLSGFAVFLVAALSVKFKTLRSDAIWFIIGFTPHAICILQLCLRPFGLFNNNNETWFKNIAPVYIDTLHPPNLLFWAVLWEVVIVFWLIIKRLKRLYEENSIMMKQLAFQREKNMSTLLSGIEKERQRIAQELHDGSGVALSALKMKLHILKENRAPESHVQHISGLMKEVDRIYEDIRGISHNLMPKTLSKLGLYPAIDELVNQFRTAAPQIKFSYYKKTSANHFSETAKINIFRIIQELLANVVKHSEATEVTLQLIKHSDSLMISVEDDGKGFDTREVKNGIGLTSVESRVQILNGTLSIDAAPQNGTFISVFLPVTGLN